VSKTSVSASTNNFFSPSKICSHLVDSVSHLDEFRHCVSFLFALLLLRALHFFMGDSRSVSEGLLETCYSLWAV